MLVEHPILAIESGDLFNIGVNYIVVLTSFSVYVVGPKKLQKYFQNYEDDLPKKYFLKSASAGFEPALDKVKDLYTTNDVTKQEYSDALRSYQSAHDEINSEARKRFLKRRANNSALLDDESDGLKKISGIMKTIQSGEI